MIDPQPTSTLIHISRHPREKIDTHSSHSFSISLSLLHTPTLTQAVRARLSLHKQLFPRVTASTRSLSVTSYKSLTPPLMIALQLCLKGTLPASTHKQHTHASFSLCVFLPLCLSLSLSLSQEPQGPLGCVAPNTKCLGFVWVKHLTTSNVTGVQMKHKLCLSIHVQIHVSVVENKTKWIYV